MPKQHVYLGKITNPSTLKDMIKAKSLKEQSQPVTVQFEGEWKGRLDLSYPLAAVWANIIDGLQESNRPVYVEIDPDTNFITRLYVPKAARVWRIQLNDEYVVYISFFTSQARHYLRRNHPDFTKMLADLEAARDMDTTLLVTATNDDFEIIDVRPLPSSFGNDGPPGPPPPPPPDPPVTLARATDLFNMMNAESCIPCASVSPCISFKYPDDGCWIRAHLMCYLMVAEAETPEKIYIEVSPEHGSLITPSSNSPFCQVAWAWHVAPTLMVIQDSGPDIKMVIDPSLFNGPVTVDEWKAIMGDPAATLTPVSWADHYYLSGGTRTQAEADYDMRLYRWDLDVICATYGPPPFTCPIVTRCFFITDRSTISKDEVDAMLSFSNPAIIEAAFFIVVEGLRPDELGITAATLSGVPDIAPTLIIAPSVSDMTVEVMPTIGLEDPAHLPRRQRITWKYKISFTTSDDFTSEMLEVHIAASISTTTSSPTTVSANTTIYLITQPNPYEIDGETAWLSTDLRVFQIRTGETRFNKLMSADGSDFITDAIQNLNNGTAGGDTFEMISVNQQTSRLELSQTVDSVSVYNFAIAKVRYRALTVSATDVRVFFRLFPASSTSLEYNQSTTYRRTTISGVVKPLLGIIGGEVATIPCFAAPRINSATQSMDQQTDPPNVQTILPNPGGAENVQYFGCWLDINQTQLQFPLNPSPTDGPWSSGRLTIQEHVRNEHQCLVAEIAFNPTPIPAGASPSGSDKLAQRNLAIVESDNPGDIASHRIPHTFEIKPTRQSLKAGEEYDELMIDWGNIPAGNFATLYIGGINTNEILKLATKTYRSHRMVRIDSHTLQCETGGITYIPIPQGGGSNYPGMISVDLPSDVKKGQVYRIVVNQVTSAVKGHATHETEKTSGRRILGSFQITIPVRIKEEMLAHQQRLLSNIRWILRAIPNDNRWFPVFDRYVKQVASRVDALGGDSGKVVASPAGDWKEKGQRCRLLGIITIILLALLIISFGALSGVILIPAVAVFSASFIAVTYYWTKNCQPGKCRVLKSILAGAGIGSVVLAILLLAGISAPQTTGVLIAGGIITVIVGVVCWIRGCF